MLVSASTLRGADVIDEEVGKADENPVRKLFLSKYNIKNEVRSRVLVECDGKTFQLLDSVSHEEVKEFFVTCNDVVPCFWSPKVHSHLTTVFKDKVLTKLVELMRLYGNSWSVAHMCVSLPLPEDTMMILLASDSFKDHFTSTHHPKGYTLLHLAIEQKSLVTCKAIMRCSDRWLDGTDPGFFVEDLDGMIPLQKANEDSAKECLDYLMGSQSQLVGQKTSGIFGFFGADIIRSFEAMLESKSYEKTKGMLKDNPQLVNEAFVDGSTALHKVKDPKTIEVLLEFGADVSTTNHQGDTPLHAIIRAEYNKENKLVAKNRQNCVLTLLAYSNCDPDYRNLKDGATPSHVAAQMCDLMCLKALIIFNADLSLVNCNRQSVLDVVKLKDWQPGIDLLWMLKASSCSVMDSYPGQSNILSLQKMLFRRQSLLESSDEEDDFMDTHSNLASLENALTFLPPDQTQLTNPHDLDNLLQQVSLSRRPKVGDRVLSLDGGGIKGLVLIEILCAIEERTSRRIVDLFDWIVGTSTGGILALALVYTDKPLKELRKMYFKLKDKIFAKCWNGSIPYSNTEALTEILKETFGEDQKLGSKDYPHVLITATDISHDPSKLVFFNNYEDGELGKDQLIWVAARCTSAAPVHFEQYEHFVDGGVKANNPSPDALTKIHDYYKKKKKQKCKMSCFVSLGCGRFDKERKDTQNLNLRQHLGNFTWWHPINGLIKLKQSFSELLGILVTEMVESDYQPVENAKSHCEQMDAKFYRLSPHVEEMVELDEQECERLVNLLIKTKLYILQSSSVLDDISRYTVM